VTTPGREAAAGWLGAGRFAGLTPDGRQEVSARLASIADRVVAVARVGPDDRVVDVGAGTGLLTERALPLVGRGGLVAAVDQSTGALAQIRAPKVGGALCRVVGDVAALPLETCSMDVALARSVLIYLDDLPGAVAEIGRVLRPGGRLSVFEPVNSGRVHDARLHGLAADELAAIGRALAAATSSAGAMIRFSEAALRAAAETAGFRDVTVAHDAARQTLTGRDAVSAHLSRSSYPGAPSPLAVITDTLGADLAARYAEAWREAVDAQGTITYTTPTIFATAVAGHGWT